jgi:hypothetical protein
MIVVSVFKKTCNALRIKGLWLLIASFILYARRVLMDDRYSRYIPCLYEDSTLSEV